MHGDHVHVPFAKDLIRSLRSFGNVQPVQIPALVKDLCLRRIEVFGFSVSHYASAESDHLTANIHDRKDHAVPEFVVHASLLVESGNARLQDHVVGKAFAPQVRAQIVVRAVGISETEVTHCGRIQLSLSKVSEPLHSFL